jgi:uncharacterized RDD family membrane protein YckC
VDVAAGVGAALALSSTVGMYYARRAVVTLRIGEPDTFWQGPIPLMLGVVGEVTFLLPFTLFLAFGLDLLPGGSLGKRVFGLRIVGAAGSAATRGRRIARTFVKSIACWGVALSLVLGLWHLGAVTLGLGLVVAVGSLAALGPAGRTLHDRLSGTQVVR